MNDVFSLSFHHLLIFFWLLLQVYVFTKNVFLQLLVLLNVISFVCCQIYFGNFILCTMVVVLVKEAKLVIIVDDLDFKIIGVTFQAKMLNRYGTFD